MVIDNLLERMMQMTRSDGWNLEHDNILANTVIEFIRNGGTQLKAFEAVADRLNRTGAACGFRWNSTLRKDYDDEIRLAKEVRMEGRLSPSGIRTNRVASTSSMLAVNSTPVDTLIQFLETALDQLKDMKRTIDVLQTRNQELENKLTTKDSNPTNDLNKLMDILKRSDIILNKEKPTA